jgi:hypothetical protein
MKGIIKDLKIPFRKLLSDEINNTKTKVTKVWGSGCNSRY